MRHTSAAKRLTAYLFTQCDSLLEFSAQPISVSVLKSNVTLRSSTLSSPHPSRDSTRASLSTIVVVFTANLVWLHMHIPYFMISPTSGCWRCKNSFLGSSLCFHVDENISGKNPLWTDISEGHNKVWIIESII